MYLFLDVIFAMTFILDETVPWICYFRESFMSSRRLLLIQWLIMGNLISWVYKGALLSSLIAIRYTEPIDTIDQMEKSGLPLYCLGNTLICWYSNTDPRMNQNVMKHRRFDIPFDGKIEDKYLEE